MAGYDTVHRTKKYKYKKNERNKNIWRKKGEFGANWIMDFFLVDKRKKMYHKGRPNFSFEIF